MITVNVFSPQNLLCLILANRISCAMGHKMISTDHFFLANMIAHENNSNAKIFYDYMVAENGTGKPLKRIDFLNAISPALWRSLDKYGHWKTSSSVCGDILEHKGNTATIIWNKMERGA